MIKGIGFCKMFSAEQEFLYRSIQDTQLTIRALDVKLGFLFVIFLSPLLKSEDLYEVYLLLKDSSLIYFFLPILIFWFSGIFSIFLALLPINNPKVVIDNTEKTEHIGVWCHNSHIFKLQKIDWLCNFPIEPLLKVSDYVSGIPKEKDLTNELVSDLYKLVFIREIKLRRVKVSVFSSFILVSLSMSLAISYTLTQ